MRFAIAQLNFTVGAFAANLAKITESAGRARAAGARLLILPELATTGETEITAMGTHRPFVDWGSILFYGAQLDRQPLEKTEEVKTKTVIGKTAAQPLELDIPFYVSHMSFGALSREAKIALARAGCVNLFSHNFAAASMSLRP